MATRLNRAREGCDLPARAGCRRVLDRPGAHVHRGRPAVEQLDEVVRVRRTAVAATCVDLTDDDVGRRAVRGRREYERAGDEKGEKESNSMHRQLRSGEG